MITIDGRTKTSVYVRCATAADRGAWSVERDIAWAEIDRDRAYARPEVLASLRDAALIESYHPLNLARLLRATLDDIDAGVVFSLELYEGFKHFHSLLDSGGEAGKKLDFLLQELNREANTLLSKTAGVAGEGLRITELGLLMKSEIEKAREQVQNVE